MEDENKIETTEGQEGAESREDSFLGGWNEEDEETGAGEEIQEGHEGQDGQESQQTTQEGQKGQQDAQGTQDGQQGQEDTQGGQETKEGAQGTQDGQEGQAGTQAAPEGQQGQQAQPVPRDIVLDRDGTPLTIPAAEVPGLLHRGLDYELLKQEYDEVRPALDLMRSFAEKAGMSLTDYASHLRVQAKQASGMTEEDARQAVALEDREVRVAAQEAAERARLEKANRAQESARQAQERIRRDAAEFAAVYPEAAKNYRDIPQAVWDAVNGGMSLVAAYGQYQQRAAAEAAKAQEAARAQAEKNANASTGSMKSSGSGTGPKDPFLDGWNEG